MIGLEGVYGYNCSPLFVAVIEVAFYDAHNNIIREYPIPLSASKPNDAARAIKNAHALWKKCVGKSTLAVRE